MVIYFIDLDDYDTNYETKKLFEDIKKYCKTHAYELVFFCRDVEEVYLGKRVNDKDKVNEVKRFKSKKMIEAVLPQNLSQNEYKINGSNILNVLDKEKLIKFGQSQFFMIAGSDICGIDI